MEDIDRAWRSVAERQHGAVAHRQLSAAGLTDRQIEMRAGGRELVPLHLGVYRVRGAAPCWHQAVMAACLATDGVASHRSAAALWGFRGCEREMVEVTIWRRRQAELEDVVCHKTKKLDAVDVTERDGIPLTVPARTLLDLGAVVGLRAVERALEGAIHRNLVTLAELDATLRRVGARGRNGTGVLRELLRDRAPGQAATESPLEDDLVRLLWHANLEPKRQWVVPLPSGRSLRLDLAFPEVRVAVEVQGFIWHASRDDLQRDCDRHNLLRVLGWQVLAFTAHDIRHRPGYTVETVWRAIRGAATTSDVV